MLEFGLHQGTSLYGRTPQDALRLISVAAAPGGRSLEVLWTICTHLQGQGYSAVVLDGTANETADAPGLIDLLEHNLWIEAPQGKSTRNEQLLAVLPAKRGLAAVAPFERTSTAPLRGLQPLLRRYAVVVLYAPIPVLASCLTAENLASPLLLLEEGDKAVMKTYADLKWLALHAGLAGTVVRLAHGQRQRAAAHQQLRVLCECADTHLGRIPRTLALDPDRPADLQRLTLELLENAETLAPAGMYATLPSSRDTFCAAHFATSH